VEADNHIGLGQIGQIFRLILAPGIPRIGQSAMHRYQIGYILIEGVLGPAIVNGLLHLLGHFLGQTHRFSQLAGIFLKVARWINNFFCVCNEENKETW